jgi:hypothetical protein
VPPEEFEPLAVPAKDRLGLDQQHRLAPSRREPSKEDEDGPIRAAQLRTPDLATDDLELLTQQAFSRTSSFRERA